MMAKKPPGRAIPIGDVPLATALDQLSRSSFSVVAAKVKVSLVSDLWEYTFNDGRELALFHKDRDAGRIVTVQGYVDGVATLYAKLAT